MVEKWKQKNIWDQAHKSRMRQAGASKPIGSVFISCKYIDVQSKIAAVELT